MGISGAIIAGAGVLSGGISKRSSSKFNQAIYNQNAQFAEQEARWSEAQADDALVRGEDEVNTIRMKVRQAIGTARAAYAAQGVEVNDGSASNVQVGMSYVGERDALTVRNNAAREAWGYKTKAWGSRVQAWNYRVGASLEANKAYQAIPETILGLGQVAYNYGSVMKAPNRSAPSGFGEAGNAGR